MEKKEEQPLCPLWRTEYDATKHVLYCGRGEEIKQRNIGTSNIIVQIFREKKRKTEERSEKV